MRRTWLFIALAMLLPAAGCMDQDPFGQAQRRVAGDYSLEQWEDFETYYLVSPGHEQGGDAVDGTVQRIGWNDRYIIAERRATFGGEVDGWMVVDAKLGTVRGPYGSDEIARNPALRGIRAMPAADAWDRLPPNPAFFIFLAAVAIAGAVIVVRRRRNRAGRSPA
jgi:hypothetical protein